MRRNLPGPAANHPVSSCRKWPAPSARSPRRCFSMANRDHVDASPSRGTALASEHLSRVVGEKALVNEISVEVQVGEVLAVVGHSGSGKTSFLRLLNRLDEPTGGIVR